MTKSRRKTPPQLALRIARAQLRALHRSMDAFVPFSPPRTGPPQFIQCWAVGRGYSGVTQALDSAGQVWERVSVMQKIDGVNKLLDSWWTPLSMQRRALTEKEEA